MDECDVLFALYLKVAEGSFDPVGGGGSSKSADAGSSTRQLRLDTINEV